MAASGARLGRQPSIDQSWEYSGRTPSINYGTIGMPLPVSGHVQTSNLHTSSGHLAFHEPTFSNTQSQVVLGNEFFSQQSHFDKNVHFHPHQPSISNDYWYSQLLPTHHGAATGFPGPLPYTQQDTLSSQGSVTHTDQGQIGSSSSPQDGTEHISQQQIVESNQVSQHEQDNESQQTISSIQSQQEHEDTSSPMSQQQQEEDTSGPQSQQKQDDTSSSQSQQQQQDTSSSQSQQEQQTSSGLRSQQQQDDTSNSQSQQQQEETSSSQSQQEQEDTSSSKTQQEQQQKDTSGPLSQRQHEDVSHSVQPQHQDQRISEPSSTSLFHFTQNYGMRPNVDQNPGYIPSRFGHDHNVRISLGQNQRNSFHALPFSGILSGMSQGHQRAMFEAQKGSAASGVQEGVQTERKDQPQNPMSDESGSSSVEEPEQVSVETLVPLFLSHYTMLMNLPLC